MNRPNLPNVALLAALAGCSASKTPSDQASHGNGSQNVAVAENNGKSADASGDKTKPDDLSVEVAVPMGLVDPEYLARVVAKLPAAFTPAKTSSDLCRGPQPSLTPRDVPASIGTKEWDECPGKPPFIYERMETSEPAGEIMVARDAVTRVKLVLAAAVGDGGYFGKSDLKVLTSGGKGGRRFALPAGEKAQFAEVSYDRANFYPYIVDFYEKLAPAGGQPLPACALNGALVRSMRLEFSRPLAGAKILVHLLDFHVDEEYPKYCKYTEITYDTGRDALTLVESWDRLVAGDKSKYITNIEYLGDKVVVTGAVRWNQSNPHRLLLRDDPHASHLEYANLDDTDVFRAVAKVAGAQARQAVQQLAFLPGDQRAKLPARPDASVFTTNSYYDVQLDHVLKLLRDAAIAPDCATAGDRLRRAHDAQGLAVPPALAAAPTSFCAGNAALTRQALEAVVKAVCLVDAPAAFPLGIVNGAGETGDLCPTYFHAAILMNPQTIEVVPAPDPDDPTKTVLNPIEHVYKTSLSELKLHVPYDGTYAELEAALGLGQDFPDLSVLWSDAKFPVPVPAPDYFAKAEPVPAKTP